MKTPRTCRCGEFFAPRRGRRYPPQVLSLRRIMNCPGNQAASWRDDAGDDLAASVGRSRRACVWPPFKRGAPRSGGGSGFPRGSIPPPRCARQLPLSKGRLRRRTCPARARAESRPSAPGATRAAACPGALPPHSLRCARWGAFLSRGRFLADRAFSHRLCFWNHRPSLWKNSPGH